ncbi:flagellar protein FlgN [Pseudomonas sp. ZM23]|uniref:Flagellar protein FlgN n=1 Tax=Pseudomonas triclosanedens TaxID=2961893 RepID=A0ABY6ZYQ2_9PSED|nr:flagellar protein FlgN [Pseudomonas triclosanedens]MCP8462733.1 flagellar protein FlgN [Pseudomonas triclosanedens]MCP8468352.1 flagellar protein FlgN [Pseudomonas triclosanedens]MCP8475111.1 flagellar protein FlgN [Pseudomonas triclosanedens]WAI49919.1 flagellar protein FlgN [Pseudomonas triclosanedens]
MTQRARLLQVVDQDIQQDARDCLGLRDRLQELYRHLLARDSAQIDRLNPEIQALLEAVTLRAQRRSKVLRAFGLQQDAEGMRTLLSNYPPPRREELQQEWLQLGQLTAQCKRLNERNGKLLAMHHDILSQLMGDVREQAVYSQQGY